MSTAVGLIVGLGNPGAEYAPTRHNAGFWLADELARRHGARWSAERKFQGEVARATIAGRDVRLIKPMTYMNRSGLSVQSLAAYLKLPPEEILVAHDEIDLPVGTLRLKIGGGHGGHNGLRDLHQHIGEGYRRLRIGVGRPENSADVIDYVLEKPRKDEKPQLEESIQRAADAVERLLSYGVDKAMQWLHSSQGLRPTAEPRPAERDGVPKREET
jgi:PTH1 family peptidyl-tRNA hydrolase